MLFKNEEIYDIDVFEPADEEEVDGLENTDVISNCFDIDDFETVDDTLIEVETENTVTSESEACLSDNGFSMSVEDVFNLVGRGIVVTGTTEGGICSENQKVYVCFPDGTYTIAKVAAIEHNKKILKQVMSGTPVSILLKGLKNIKLTKGCQLKGIK